MYVVHMYNNEVLLLTQDAQLYQFLKYYHVHMYMGGFLITIIQVKHLYLDHNSLSQFISQAMLQIVNVHALAIYKSINHDFIHTVGDSSLCTNVIRII